MKAAAYIWKYRSAGNYMFSNYFLNPVYVDKIKVTEIPPDGIPIYNEQLEKSDEVLEFTAGDFDVKLSLLSGALSANGDSLKDFLLPRGDRNFFYLCIVEFGDETNPASKRFGGKIELNSIEADLTAINNKYDISFKVTGLIKELSVLQEKTQLQALHASVTLDMFISGCIIPDPMPAFLGYSGRLNWEERIGFEPVLMWEVYNDIIGRGIGKGKWSVFKELVKGFGFMFKMSVIDRANIYEVNFPLFMVETFWRSEGLNEVTIYRKTNIEKYSDLNTYKNYFLITHRSNLLGLEGRYTGMLAVNDGSVYIADGLAGEMFEDIEFDQNSGAITTIVNGQNPPVISQDAATIIHLPTYSTQYLFNTEGITTNLINSNMSFMSLFCRRYEHCSLPGMSRFVIIKGLKNIIEKTIGKECEYFVNGVKKSFEYISVWDSENILDLYNTNTIGTEKYFCKAIKSLDIINETVKSQWTQC